jgi:hypothetical protein
MRHTESIRQVGNVHMRLEGEFHVIDAEVTTAAGIKKLLSMSEADASWLVAQIADRLAERPKEGAAQRFQAAVRASR